MKKLILSAAIVLGSFTGFAQETEEAPVQEAATTEATAEEVFTAVEADAIPAPVTAALEVAYPGATISTAEVNEAMEYKLMMYISNFNMNICLSILIKI